MLVILPLLPIVPDGAIPTGIDILEGHASRLPEMDTQVDPFQRKEAPPISENGCINPIEGFVGRLENKIGDKIVGYCDPAGYTTPVM